MFEVLDKQVQLVDLVSSLRFRQIFLFYLFLQGIFFSLHKDKWKEI